MEQIINLLAYLPLQFMALVILCVLLTVIITKSIYGMCKKTFPAAYAKIPKWVFPLCPVLLSMAIWIFLYSLAIANTIKINIIANLVIGFFIGCSATTWYEIILQKLMILTAHFFKRFTRK